MTCLRLSGKNPPASAGDAGFIPGLRRFLQKEMITHSGGLQSMESQRVGYDLAIEKEREGLCRGSPSIFDSFYFSCQGMSCTSHYNATTFSSFRLSEICAGWRRI